jgi:hypothetical protein
VTFPARRSAAKLWALWLALVFGLFNLYGPSLQSTRTPDDPPGLSSDALARRLDPLRFLSVLVRNDGDTARYYSYANAMLGRPYSPYYVRAMKDWTAPSSGADEEGGGARADVTPERPLWPWRDFSLEYPPGMAIFAVLPALLTRDFDLYHRLFGVEMELLLTLAVFAAVRATELRAQGQGARVLGFSIATTAALGFIAARRYDACVSASLGLMFWALAARRPMGAGAVLALGVVAKGAPILFAPLAAVHYAATRRWRALFVSLAAAGAVGLVAGLAFFTLAGDHWRDAFAYHGGRPLQIESSWSALLILLSAFDPSLVAGSVYSFGSDNLVSPWEPLLRPVAETAPFVATLAVCCWFWRDRRDKGDDFEGLVAFAKGVCVIVIAFAALGKVFSPQYLVWLTPVAALASLQASRAANICLLGGLVLTQIEYPFLYIYFAANPPPAFGLLALARNAALLAWAAQLLASPERRPANEAAGLAAQRV